MSIMYIILLFLRISIYISPTVLAQKPLNNARVTYIVHVQREPNMASFSNKEEREQWHRSFLPTTTTAGSGQPRIIYSYNNIISGFAARLTKEELEAVKNKNGFIHAIPDRLLHLATTHSPSFLGLDTSSTGFWASSNYGKGVIVGVLDTGVTPDHPSFSDQGMPSPPAKWTGVCGFTSATCNNKLIGARTFLEGTNAVQPTDTAQEPYDNNGHGTHTASTAAGMFVENANINGLANGTAAGMAPYAHLAIYKVCHDNGTCATTDVLAGIDQAVQDGVDIISASIGGVSANFYEDNNAIGSFAAMEKGVFVSFAAGNDGPANKTLSNEAPWIITVGASTMDRYLTSTVVLGSGDAIIGQTAYQPESFEPTPLPLIYPGFTLSSAATCTNGSLDTINVKGMMVVCDEGDNDYVEKGSIVQNAGGVAMIIANYKGNGYTTPASPHVLPAAHISYNDGVSIKTYISTASAPTATILFNGTLFGVIPSPMMASFSSRGPSIADPFTLKPDIIAPGVNILAAWPFSPGPTPSIGANFNLESGTSMATPHISGIAGLLKAVHPDWSPAAIKSAMMTSADITGNDGKPIADYTLDVADYFGTGAGHVNPTKASVPGFVYDLDPASYIPYLCGLGYTDKQVTIVVGSSVTCASVTPITGSELNYPSFMVFLTASNSYTVTVNRTVTNVGDATSTYSVTVVEPSGGSVTVNPETITFSSVNQQSQYSVTFSNSVGGTGTAAYSQGSLTWASSDGSTTVRSPIMVAVV
ncbi:Peptidase S8 subtilisin-related protein [Dioscorea alata]|uniref:Peptidase S8 subtilisin-related protein n=1 Tax=Dioscorea alata TaxID=55571 RepID=A0ACB7WGY7_DIOAL|nr:Peptidase S8 subtilisin-related protein [Dioscorea alata]